MQEMMELATQGPLGLSSPGRWDGKCKGPDDGILGVLKESHGARVTGKKPGKESAIGRSQRGSVGTRSQRKQTRSED